MLTTMFVISPIRRRVHDEAASQPMTRPTTTGHDEAYGVSF